MFSTVSGLSANSVITYEDMETVVLDPGEKEPLVYVDHVGKLNITFIRFYSSR